MKYCVCFCVHVIIKESEIGKKYKAHFCIFQFFHHPYVVLISVNRKKVLKDEIK